MFLFFKIKNVWMMNKMIDKFERSLNCFSQKQYRYFLWLFFCRAQLNFNKIRRHDDDQDWHLSFFRKKCSRISCEMCFVFREKILYLFKKSIGIGWAIKKLTNCKIYFAAKRKSQQIMIWSESHAHLTKLFCLI